tara:strand:+ start:305 stop:814 length:510 start_codon:yes stop_codon:yes gene_type:complete
MAENKMRKIEIEKIVLNIGTAPDQSEVEKAVKLLSLISGKKAVKTVSDKRIAGWKIRPGLAIGAKVTVRGNKATLVLIKRLLDAKEFRIKRKSFTRGGFSFGIEEYIDIEDVEYEPSVGLKGLDVCVSLKRSGFRVKHKLKGTRIGKSHIINAEDAANFAVKELGVELI